MPEYREYIIGQFPVGQIECGDPYQTIASVYDAEDLEPGADLRLHVEGDGTIAVITRRI